MTAVSHAIRRGVIVLALGQTPRAGAQEPAVVTVSVLNIESDAGDEELAQSMGEALREQIGLRGWKVGPARDFVELKLIFCSGEARPDCMASAGRSLGVEHVLYGTMRRSSTDPSTRQIELHLVGVADGREQRLPDTLAASDATPAALRERAPRWIASLTGKSAPVAASVRLEILPLGAEIWLDGRQVGVAGSEPAVLQDIPPGAHHFEVRRYGFRPRAQDVTIEAGPPVTLRIQLLENPPRVLVPSTVPAVLVEQAQERTDDKRAWRVAFWSALSITAIAGGITAWSAVSLNQIEEGKEQAIAESRSRFETDQPGYINSNSSQDACNEARQEGGATVAELCTQGESRATLTNVMIAVTAGAAIGTGLLFWKAYLVADGARDRAGLSLRGRF